MRVVIDTNVLLAVVPSKSKYYFVYQLIKNKQLDLAISNEIALEYEEQLKFRYKLFSVEDELTSLFQQPNIRFYMPDFFWNFITADPDDNKFVDCAIAANADYIITNDAHFNVLRNIAFPKVNILTLHEFISLLSTSEL